MLEISPCLNLASITAHVSLICDSIPFLTSLFVPAYSISLFLLSPFSLFFVFSAFHPCHLLACWEQLPETYPRLTLLGQAWGAVRVGQEALSKLVPEVGQGL